MLFILFYIQKAALYLKLGCETEKDEDMFMLMEQFLDAVNVSTYCIILYFTFLFSLFVFVVSAVSQYNVIWTGTGLSHFRFGSGMVPALLF